jgi:hypothetical protein
MSLSSEIAQDNTGRLAGRKGPANRQARLFPQHGLITLRRTNIQNRAGRCVTIARRLNKTTHHRVTDNEKFRLQKYHNSTSFQSHPLSSWRFTMEPTGFDHQGSVHAGLS